MLYLGRERLPGRLHTHKKHRAHNGSLHTITNTVKAHRFRVRHTKTVGVQKKHPDRSPRKHYDRVSAQGSRRYSWITAKTHNTPHQRAEQGPQTCFAVDSTFFCHRLQQGGGRHGYPKYTHRGHNKRYEGPHRRGWAPRGPTDRQRIQASDARGAAAAEAETTAYSL